MKTTVIYHSADYDGIFCREIARKFLPEANLIGWDYGDPLIPFPTEGTVYVLDLSPDCFDDPMTRDGARLVWIDHHKSAIEKHPALIPGYRIDGVAACRLAWQWFQATESPEPILNKPTKQDFVDRKVSEPIAVRLAGEYDVWDKRDPNAELFQHGLRSQCLDGMWPLLLSTEGDWPARAVTSLLNAGTAIQYARDSEYREVITQQGFDVQFEGHCYLACNSHELDIRSQLFEAGIKPHHDGLLGFTFNGKDWRVSLYGLPGKDIDHSQIAVRHGGGGHKQACGFRAQKLPWIL